MKRTTKSATPKRDRGLSCEKLMQAGTEVFAKHGFHGATTRLIAARAKVNESLIARYFKGKDGLFIAIVSELIKRRRQDDLPYPPQETLEAELEKYFLSRFHADHRHRDLFRIAISQGLIDQKFNARLRAELPFTPHPVLSERLLALQKSGKICDTRDLERLHKMIEGQLLGVFLFSYLVLGETEKQVEETLHYSARFWANALSTEK